MKRILCITPLLKEIEYILFQIDKTAIYEPTITKSKLISLLKRNVDITHIFCNPNEQNYMLDEEVLKNFHDKIINTCSTGTNHIDKEYCKNNNITIWSLTKDYELIKNLPSTAEVAFGLMLDLLKNITKTQSFVKHGIWDSKRFMNRQIEGLTVGIVGYGRLGHFFEKFARGFGMNVIVYDPYKIYYNGYQCNTLEELIKLSDVITLHVHVTDETRYMINIQSLSSSMKNPIVINTSRGEIVNENDIIDAFEAGFISGYGADVIEDEFKDDWYDVSQIINNMNKHNIIVTPHIGGGSKEGTLRAFKWAMDKFKN